MRLINASQENRFTGIMGALPRRPPNSITSPTSLPTAGISRTAVVFWFTMPMAISSAMIPEIEELEVLPGMAIMSSPTEQTQVMASSFSRLKAPAFTALIMP